MEQLSMFAEPDDTEPSTPASSIMRYTIRSGALWWDGRVWTEDQHMAIGLHGDVVLQREIELYLQGVNFEITTG